MKFFLDHDVNDAVADALRRHGHEAIVLRDVLAPETNDALVFSKAQESGCVMVTCNRNDSSSSRLERSHHGLIILIRRHAARTECANVLRLVDEPANRGSPRTSTSPDGVDRLEP